MSIIDQVKTVEDACQITGIQLSDITPYSEPKNDFQAAVNSFAHSVIVIQALNGDWIPDYDDDDQEKWEIWWDMEGQAAGGSGFSLYYVYNYCSHSYVGARLVFKSRELAIYFATQFLHLFEGFMVVKK